MKLISLTIEKETKDNIFFEVETTSWWYMKGITRIRKCFYSKETEQSYFSQTGESLWHVSFDFERAVEAELNKQRKI